MRIQGQRTVDDARLRMTSEGGPSTPARRIVRPIAADLETELARQRMTSEGGRCDPIFYTDSIVLGGAQSMPYASHNEPSAHTRAVRLIRYVRTHASEPDDAVGQMFSHAGLPKTILQLGEDLNDQHLLRLEHAACHVLGIDTLPSTY